MWSDKTGSFHFLRKHYALLILVLSTTAIMINFSLLFYDEESNFTNFIESLIALSALLSVIYVSVCFTAKKNEIKRLLQNLKVFEDFSSEERIAEAEESAKFYTKSFVLYGIIGNGLYGALPFMSLKDCNDKRTKHMIRLGIPCKIIARYVLPFKYDESPIYEFVVVQQITAALIGTIVVVTVTMLLCGILTHISVNLVYLKENIRKISNIQDHNLEGHITYCVKYHIAILEISNDLNDAFSLMMLIHITWTSFIISVLGFGIIMENNYWNMLRFILHLIGWLLMLFLVSFYGQILMDKSSDISMEVYDSEWYRTLPKIRENLVLILLRSQRPIVLKAAQLKTMSLSTFLGVLYSAYTYFTLLLKLKP